MGAEVFPVFHPRVHSASFDADGKQLLREHMVLDDIARDLEFAALSAYGENREIPEVFEGDPDELEEILGGWDKWFSIEDGLKTIDGLITAIRNDPRMASRLLEPDYVCSDLEALASCLRIAREENAQFRLEVM